jgi:ribosome-binding factor A
MSTRRIERIEQLLKEELCAIIHRELKDPRIGFVTVTGVEVSADLGHAKVFLSVMGDAQAKERTMSGVRSAAGYVQRVLGARVKMKTLPRLEFFLDESIDHGFHIMDVLKKIDEEKKND